VKDRRIVFLVTFVAVFAGGAGSVCLFAFYPTESPVRDPQLPPEQVIQIHLDALMHNDPVREADIAITFRDQPSAYGTIGTLLADAKITAIPADALSADALSADALSQVGQVHPGLDSGQPGQADRAFDLGGGSGRFLHLRLLKAEPPAIRRLLADRRRIPKRRLPESYPDTPVYRGVPHDDMPI